MRRSSTYTVAATHVEFEPYLFDNVKYACKLYGLCIAQVEFVLHHPHIFTLFSALATYAILAYARQQCSVPDNDAVYIRSNFAPMRRHACVEHARERNLHYIHMRFINRCPRGWTWANDELRICITQRRHNGQNVRKHDITMQMFVRKKKMLSNKTRFMVWIAHKRAVRLVPPLWLCAVHLKSTTSARYILARRLIAVITKRCLSHRQTQICSALRVECRHAYGNGLCLRSSLAFIIICW